MLTTLSYYYTLNGSLGGNNEWVNISSFFVGVAIAFIINYFLINNSIGKGMPNAIAGAMIIITILIFFLFTFKPPIIPLFQDPQNYTFGI
jgi:L-lactate permease